MPEGGWSAPLGLLALAALRQGERLDA